MVMKNSLAFCLVLILSILVILPSCENDEPDEYIEAGQVPGWACGAFTWTSDGNTYSLNVDEKTVLLSTGDNELIISAIDQSANELVSDTAKWLFYAAEYHISLQFDMGSAEPAARLSFSEGTPDWFPENGLDYSQTTGFVPDTPLKIPDWLNGNWQGESAVNSAYEGMQVIFTNGSDLFYQVDNMSATSLMDDYVNHDADIIQNEAGVNEPEGLPYFYFTAKSSSVVQYMFEKTSDTTVQFVLRTGTVDASTTQVDAVLMQVD